MGNHADDSPAFDACSSKSAIEPLAGPSLTGSFFARFHLGGSGAASGSFQPSSIIAIWVRVSCRGTPSGRGRSSNARKCFRASFEAFPSMMRG